MGAATTLCGVHFLCTWITSLLVKWFSAATSKTPTKVPFTGAPPPTNRLLGSEEASCGTSRVSASAGFG